jgi:uncharacterized protein
MGHVYGSNRLSTGAFQLAGTLLDFDSTHHHPYHAPIMLAECIGPVELRGLAARQAGRQLRFKAAELARLAELLTPRAAGKAAELSAGIGFAEGQDGFPVLRIKLQGVLQLVCQRCLETLPWPIDFEVHLTVVSAEAEVAACREPFETVVMGDQGLQLASIVEDEILASLPLAPMHRTPAECGQIAVVLASGHGGDTTSANQAFSALAGLLGRVDTRAE